MMQAFDHAYKPKTFLFAFVRGSLVHNSGANNSSFLGGFLFFIFQKLLNLMHWIKPFSFVQKQQNEPRINVPKSDIFVHSEILQPVKIFSFNQKIPDQQEDKCEKQREKKWPAGEHLTPIQSNKNSFKLHLCITTGLNSMSAVHGLDKCTFHLQKLCVANRK